MIKANGIAVLAEEQSAVRLITGDLLELAGFQVREAACTADAVDLLYHAADVDLVVADLDLPHGEVLANTIKLCCPQVKLLLLASGARPTPDMLPMNVAFLTKPYTPAALAFQLGKLGFAGTHRLGMRSAAQQQDASLSRLQRPDWRA